MEKQCSGMRKTLLFQPPRTRKTQNMFLHFAVQWNKKRNDYRAWFHRQGLD